MYNIAEMLKVAYKKKAKKQTINSKQLYNWPRKRPIKKLEKKNKKEILKTSSSNSNIKITECMARKTRAR